MRDTAHVYGHAGARAEVARPVVELRGLRIEIPEAGRILAPVRDVSFALHPGRTLAIVGETGSGKTLTASSLLRLLPAQARIAAGSIRLNSRKCGEMDLAELSEDAAMLYRVRGGVIGMVFQEPLSALSPVHTVGNQLTEVIRLHARVDRHVAKHRAIHILGKVGLPGPERVLERYPHQLSGGMRQRVMIALALVAEPEVIIADEPTTALDVTTQAQVLALLKDLQKETGCALLLITHDMGVVAQIAHEVAVMYCGRVVEQGSVRSVLKTPLHPYTRGLLHSMPSLSRFGVFPGIPGAAPSLRSLPTGCAFHPRCQHADATLCVGPSEPVLKEHLAGHRCACHHAGALAPFSTTRAGEPV
jgi:oligopeptide/dipeptide ABC transporter ATP-binding protein